MVQDRVQVEVRGEIADHPDVEAEVAQLLAELPDEGVVEAIAQYARMRGLAATWFLGQQAMIVELHLSRVPESASSTLPAVVRDPLPRGVPVGG